MNHNILRVIAILVLQMHACTLWSCAHRWPQLFIGDPLPPYDYEGIAEPSSVAMERLYAAMEYLTSSSPQDDDNPPEFLCDWIGSGGELAGRDYLVAAGRSAIPHVLSYMVEAKKNRRFLDALFVYLGETQDPIVTPFLVNILLQVLDEAGLPSLRCEGRNRLPDADPNGRYIDMAMRALSELGIHAFPYLAECLASSDPKISRLGADVLSEMHTINSMPLFENIAIEFERCPFRSESREAIISWWITHRDMIGWCPELYRFRRKFWLPENGLLEK